MCYVIVQPLENSLTSMFCFSGSELISYQWGGLKSQQFLAVWIMIIWIFIQNTWKSAW